MFCSNSQQYTGHELQSQDRIQSLYSQTGNELLILAEFCLLIISSTQHHMVSAVLQKQVMKSVYTCSSLISFQRLETSPFSKPRMETHVLNTLHVETTLLRGTPLCGNCFIAGRSNKHASKTWPVLVISLPNKLISTCQAILYTSQLTSNLKWSRFSCLMLATLTI